MQFFKPDMGTKPLTNLTGENLLCFTDNMTSKTQAQMLTISGTSATALASVIAVTGEQTYPSASRRCPG